MHTIQSRVATAKRRSAIIRNMVLKARKMRTEGKSTLDIALALNIPESAARVLGRDI